MSLSCSARSGMLLQVKKSTNCTRGWIHTAPGVRRRGGRRWWRGSIRVIRGSTRSPRPGTPTTPTGRCRRCRHHGGRPPRLTPTPWTPSLLAMGVQGVQEENSHSGPQKSSYVERKEKTAQGSYILSLIDENSSDLHSVMGFSHLWASLVDKIYSFLCDCKTYTLTHQHFSLTYF